jgi:hypothetical protein
MAKKADVTEFCLLDVRLSSFWAGFKEIFWQKTIKTFSLGQWTFQPYQN